MTVHPAKTCILTFFGTYSVLKSERFLKENHIPVQVIAAPRHITTECGICIRISGADAGQAQRIIAEANIEINGVYHE